MKNNFAQIPGYFFLLVFILFSCDNGLDDVEVPDNKFEYLIETEPVVNYSQFFIKSFLQLATLQYPELKELGDKIVTGVDVYKIIYNTQFEGRNLTASGLVCLPTENGTYPILSYHNGTNTLNSKAPSVVSNSDLFTILEMLTSTGFIIMLPDYLGFGESEHMFHPFLHKESTVQSVTDMLKAVEEFVENKDNISTNNDLYISGYSQGGWTTMAVQEKLDKQNDTNFNLKASACGAGPYDLIAINEYVTGLQTYNEPYFLGYIFNSFRNLNLSTPIDEVFQQPYADRIATLYDGSKSGSQINEQLTNQIPNLFTSGYLNGLNSESIYSPVIKMLEQNSINAYKTITPTMLLHGTEDELVPPLVSDNIYADFTAAGVAPGLVTLVPIEGAGHNSGIIPSGLASIIWFISIRDGETAS